MQKLVSGGFTLENKKMKLGSRYEIGDKVIYVSYFDKPMIGKVVYYINDNYLVDLSNNTRQWVTDRELKGYTEKKDYLNVVNKYIKGRKCRCIRDYTFRDSPYAPECLNETIPANTEFTIYILFSHLEPRPINQVVTINYVALRPDTWQPRFPSTMIGGTVNIVWEDFAKYFELVK
jgi:hypothetical protein